MSSVLFGSYCRVSCVAPERIVDPDIESTVPGCFDPAVTVIMLSPRVSGASRHLGFASESSLRSSRFLLDSNILSG